MRPTQVSDAMLRALVRYYRGGSAPPPGSAEYYRGRFVVQYRSPPPPVLVRVPGLNEDPGIIGTDGSVSDRSQSEQPIGSWAAVRGDGWAMLGSFVGDVVNSHTAEAQGVRYALRFVPHGGSVLLHVDETKVISEVNRLVKGADIRHGPIRDWDALNEIVWHARTRQVHVVIEHVQDEEGGRLADRITSDPLLGTAHRLAWCAGRLRQTGIPLEGDALAWAVEMGSSGARWRADLIRGWKAFRGG